jgi:hypothetical protein
VLYYAKFVEEKGPESRAVPKRNLYRKLEGFHSGASLNGILKYFGQRSGIKTYISYSVTFGFTVRILKLFQLFCYFRSDSTIPAFRRHVTVFSNISEKLAVSIFRVDDYDALGKYVECKEWSTSTGFVMGW